MNYYNSALIFSAISAFFLLIVLFLPVEFLFDVNHDGAIDVGSLFPLLPLSWGASAFALAMNFLYVERLYIENYFRVTRVRKLMPTIISVPSLCSFLWFCFTVI